MVLINSYSYASINNSMKYKWRKVKPEVGTDTGMAVNNSQLSAVPSVSDMRGVYRRVHLSKR